MDSSSRFHPGCFRVSSSWLPEHDSSRRTSPANGPDTAAPLEQAELQGDTLWLGDLEDVPQAWQADRRREPDSFEAWMPPPPGAIPAPPDHSPLFSRLAGLLRSCSHAEVRTPGVQTELRGISFPCLLAGIDNVRGAASTGEVRLHLDLPYFGTTRILITLTAGSSIDLELQPADNGFLQNLSAAQSLLAQLSRVLRKRVRNLTVKCQSSCFSWCDSAENADREDCADEC